MPNYDAGSLNKSKRDVNKLTDIEAVKRSVRNLINTSHFDRPFHPEIGSSVRAMLFEPMTPLTALNLQRKVQEVLINFEPRIKLVQIVSNPNIDSNSYDLRIYFYVIGSNDLIEVQTFLERLR
jgi:phage baseplate assembly protein W